MPQQKQHPGGVPPPLSRAIMASSSLRAERLLKEHNPSAVIIVHVLGVPNDMETLMALKKEYGFVLMEDTCAATGSTLGVCKRLNTMTSSIIPIAGMLMI